MIMTMTMTMTTKTTTTTVTVMMMMMMMIMMMMIFNEGTQLAMQIFSRTLKENLINSLTNLNTA